MSASIDTTEVNIFAAMGAFIQSVINGVTVIKALSNNVSMPDGAFIKMTPIYEKRIATNLHSNTVSTMQVMQSIEYAIQIDCFGAIAGDWAAMLTTLFRDEYAIDQFPNNIVPLYANDAKMMPFTDAESQYEERWMFEAKLQYNPTTTVSQDSASALSVGIIEVDTTFKP